MKQFIVDYARRFYPAPITGGFAEKFRSGIGAFCGILFTGLVAHEAVQQDIVATVYLIAPMGASAVLLFALPSSPLAQPWSIVGGNAVAALIGVSFAMLLPTYPVLAAALAIMFSIFVMFILRCLHPPSGAVALTAVLGGPAIHQLGYQFVLWPVAANSLLLLLIALVYNNITRRSYPSSFAKPASLGAEQMHYRFGFKDEDLASALEQYDQIIDINPENLRQLLEKTELNAFQRKLGEILCHQIMSPVADTLEFGDSLEDAWVLLRQQPYPALPVINKAKRVIGLLSHDDFMRHAKPDTFATVAPKFKQLIQRSFKTHSNKPEVVGQIMTSPAVTIHADTHIIHIVALITTHHLHVIPVVNDDACLVGILSQTDIIKALYR